MKRKNQTKHQLAMKNPKVRELMGCIRTCWNSCIPRERGQLLSELISLGCSVSGIAENIQRSETTISRCIKEANRPDEDSDSIATIELTPAEKPKEQSTTSTGEAVRQISSKTPAKKIVGPVIKDTRPAQNHARTPAAQPTKNFTPISPIKLIELPALNVATSDQEGQGGEKTPKTSLVDAIMNQGRTFEGGIGRVEIEVEQFPKRREYNARSMKRQGKPVPPQDPHRPVS